jgi:hypothetical protein
MSDKKVRKDRGDRQKRETTQIGTKKDVLEIPAQITGMPHRVYITLPDWPNQEETALLGEIALTIRRIGELRAEAHADDKEMERLGRETRRLIAETQRELKAA